MTMLPAVKVGIVAFFVGWFLLVNGCARKAPASPDANPPRYLILDDGMSSDVLVCVPLVLASEKQQYACVPIDFVRWFLRQQKKG